MENKFEDELIKIEKLLNKVDEDLKVDNPQEDFSLFFKNIDKTFEIYNICLEELCGQLYLLELSSHSKVYRKLYHHYKHQLYSIMKFQLNLQKDLNDKIEEEKSYKSKIDILMNKVKNLKDKKSNMETTIEEQKIKIEKLIIQNNEQNKKQQMKYKQMQKRKTEKDIRFQSTSKTMELNQILEDEDSQQNLDSDYYNILNQVEEIQNDESNINPKLKNNLQKLLQDIESQKQKYQSLRNQKSMLEKYSSLVQFDNQMQTSFIMYTEEQYQQLLNQIEFQKEEFLKEKESLQAQKALDASEIEEQQRCIKQLQFKLDQFQQQLKEFEIEKSQYQLDIDNYKEQREDFEQQIENLQNSLANQNFEKQKLKKQVTELADINQTFQQEIETIAEKEQELNSKEQQIKHLYSQNTEFQERLRQLEDMEIDRDVKLEKNVQLLIDNKNKKIQMYEEELNKVIKEKKKNEIQIEEIKNQKKEIQENFQNLSENYKNQVKVITQLKNKMGSKKVGKKLKKGDKNNTNNRDKGIKKEVKRKLSKKVNINTIKNIQKQNSKNKKQKQSQEELLRSTSNQMDIQQQDIQQNNDIIENQYNNQGNQQIGTEQASSQQQYNSQSNELNDINSFEQQKENYDQKKQDMKQKNNSNDDSNANIYDSDSSEYNMQTPQEGQIEQQLQQSSLKGENFRKFMENNQEENNENDNTPVQGVSVPPVSITCNRGILTDYSSPVEYIIKEKDLVFCRETDFEQIKSCIDILAQIIGFDNFEDLNGMGGNDNQDNENKTVLKKTISSKDNTNKIMSRFKDNYQQNQQKSKLVFKRKTKLDDDDSNVSDNQSKEQIESDYDMEQFEKDLNKKPPVYKPSNTKQRKIKQSTRQTKHKSIMQEIEEEKNIIKRNYEQDYVVERKKIIQNDNNQEQIEVVEYIRIPKELQVKRSVLNPIFMKSKLKKVRTFEERLLNEFERNQRETEKIYFQMYLNIKNRYRFKPETLIKVYKLYFNKVPEFQKNLTEDYDPEKFLFNFEEFKIEFKQLIQVHQACGEMCAHLRRFYQRIDQIKYEKQRENYKVQQTIIDKLPYLLKDDYKKN